jgi:hypothetical protein
MRVKQRGQNSRSGPHSGPATHLSDDRLVEVCLERQTTPDEDAHLTACEACTSRRSRLDLLLREVSDAASADADAAFSDDRLAAQRTRILNRIEQDGRPARVIAFPAVRLSELRPLRTRPVGRWIAGAAAAGLAVGLLAGHLSHDLSQIEGPARTQTLRTSPGLPPATPGFRAVSASLNDDEFIGEIESALEGPELAVLRPLNDLTPQ